VNVTECGYAGWHVKHDTPLVPPVKLAAWHVWHVASSQSAFLRNLPWKFAAEGAVQPCSWTAAPAGTGSGRSVFSSLHDTARSAQEKAMRILVFMGHPVIS
jgi:hypothetical protein